MGSGNGEDPCDSSEGGEPGATEVGNSRDLGGRGRRFVFYFKFH